MVMGELPVHTEVLVIGGGPGGYAAAFRAADLGLDTTLVEADPQLGGVCLLRGCIPSKALLSLADLLQRTRGAERMGIRFGEPEVDLEGVRAWKQGVVDHLSAGVARLCERRGVQWVKGYARFDGSGKVRLQHSDLAGINFKHAIIATGSRPKPLPGVALRRGGRIMDSTGALALADIPTRLLVVGGGYVGLEMGSVYAALGSRVTLVQRHERLLPSADAELVAPLARRLEGQFEAIHYNTRVHHLEERGDGVHAGFEGEGRIGDVVFDRVLVATGRQVNSDDLNLESTRVQCNPDGSVAVDAQRRTTDPSIYAIGDVAGGLLLAHKAMAEGKVAAEAIAGRPSAFEPQAIPAVVYTDPQVAWCGLTEQEARAAGRPVRVLRLPWRVSGRALTMDAAEGLTKVLADPESGRVLGVGVVGRDAESLIAEGALAVEMGALATDLALTIHPHPTLSETLSEAAESFDGQPTHYLAQRPGDAHR